MEELKVEYTFDLEDFKTIEIIEHSYFPNDNITPAEEVLNWYRKNDLTCIGVRNNKHKIIASISILPLNEKTFYNIYEDKIHEASTIHGEKICKKLLRMNFIRDTKYETKIYCENGEEFMEAINRIKKYKD